MKRIDEIFEELRGSGVTDWKKHLEEGFDAEFEAVVEAGKKQYADHDGKDVVMPMLHLVMLRPGLKAERAVFAIAVDAPTFADRQRLLASLGKEAAQRFKATPMYCFMSAEAYGVITKDAGDVKRTEAGSISGDPRARDVFIVAGVTPGRKKVAMFPVEKPRGLGEADVMDEGDFSIIDAFMRSYMEELRKQ